MNSLQKLSFLCLSIIPLTVSSCKGEAEEGESKTSTPADSSADATTSKFSEIENDLGKAITAAQIKELLSVDAEIETEAEKGKGAGPARFKWASNRVEIIDPGGMNVERPVENLVQLYKPTVLKTYGGANLRTTFDKNYKSTTAEQAEGFRKQVRDEMAKQQGETGVAPPETSANGGPDLSTMIEDIPDLADGGKWDPKAKSLMILEGNQVLTILCDISDDTQECRDAAVKVAKEILNGL